MAALTQAAGVLGMIALLLAGIGSFIEGASTGGPLAIAGAILIHTFVMVILRQRDRPAQ